MLYERRDDKVVQCHLCAHRCLIRDGNRGICHVRENRQGSLRTLVYGRTIAKQVDPIEKKPLLHFYPGSRAFSIATPGCNFRCGWCQNADISQMPREKHMIMGSQMTPGEVVEQSLRQDCRSIAYTYTEPTIFFEYAYDTAKIANRKGLKNVFVSNGYMTPEMLEKADPFLDGANVDLKSFRDEFYRQQPGAKLGPILENLQIMKDMGVWLEVTTLIIPGLNDDPAELRELAHFINQELGPDTPWHVSRFHPAYKMQGVPPTPQDRIRQAVEIGREEGLHYVYSRYDEGGSDTRCAACQEMLIKRRGFRVVENRVAEGGKCPSCGTPAAGEGMASPA